MKKLTATYLISGILAGGTISSVAKSPDIVVGIVVDQLRTDYLEQLRPYFGENGFKRLMKEGVYITDVDFRNTTADAPSGSAVIYTGAWPASNGISSAERTDLQLKKNVPVLASDNGRLKVEYSPENLRLSTLSDEFYINYGNLSKIFSLSADPQMAVIGAGHAGNMTLWIDESTGRWSTSGYYGSLPPSIANKERTSPLSSKIAASTWRPMAPATSYSMGSTWKDGNFSYGFSGANRDAFTRYKNSPLGNELLTETAIDLLHNLKPTASGGAAMLNIAYSVAPVKYDYDGDNRPELIDSYVRLDRTLARLFDALGKEYGKENVLVFLSSTGYAEEPEIPEGDARIPTGEITLRKTESLLNAFLSAAHGNGDYVTSIKNDRLYLDTREIEKKGLQLTKIREEAKDFLLRMGGIGEAFTIDDILHSDNSRARDIALGIDPKNAPDIFIFFTPGWTVTDDNVYPESSRKVRVSTPPMPAFILSPELEPQIIDYPVEATAIAPTISSLIHIRAPNGAAAKPLTLNKKIK